MALNHPIVRLRLGSHQPGGTSAGVVAVRIDSMSRGDAELWHSAVQLPWIDPYHYTAPSTAAPESIRADVGWDWRGPGSIAW